MAGLCVCRDTVTARRSLTTSGPQPEERTGSQAFLGKDFGPARCGYHLGADGSGERSSSSACGAAAQPFEPGYRAADSTARTPRVGGLTRSRRLTIATAGDPRTREHGERPTARVSGEDRRGDAASASPDRGPRKPETHRGARANLGQGRATPRRSHQRGTRHAGSGSNHGDSNATDRHHRRRMSGRAEAVTGAHDSHQRVKPRSTNVGSSKSRGRLGALQENVRLCLSSRTPSGAGRSPYRSEPSIEAPDSSTPTRHVKPKPPQTRAIHPIRHRSDEPVSNRLQRLRRRQHHVGNRPAHDERRWRTPPAGRCAPPTCMGTYSSHRRRSRPTPGYLKRFAC